MVSRRRSTLHESSVQTPKSTSLGHRWQGSAVVWQDWLSQHCPPGQSLFTKQSMHSQSRRQVSIVQSWEPMVHREASGSCMHASANSHVAPSGCWQHMIMQWVAQSRFIGFVLVSMLLHPIDWLPH